MTTFSVPIVRVREVVDHPDADRLSIVRVLGYEAITQKLPDGAHRFAVAEPVIYVPEGAVIPDVHLRDRGFWNEEKDVGMLAGSAGNRVKAIRLRGILSQGLVWKVDLRVGVEEVMLSRPNAQGGRISGVRSIGLDVADFFGITKYEPPIPTSLGGDVHYQDGAAFSFDIEDEKRHPGLLDADEVVVTEKLHGTLCRVSYIPDDAGGKVVVSSKGLGAKGLVFTPVTDGEPEKNLYLRTVARLGLAEKLAAWALDKGSIVHLIGEIYGQGVQDLSYGLSTPEFAAFDVVVGGRFLREFDKVLAFGDMRISRAPVLYYGPFDREKILDVASGRSSTGRSSIDEGTIREGAVVTAVGDQTPRGLERVRPCLKFVSPEYLTRKGGTEYN